MGGKPRIKPETLVRLNAIGYDINHFIGEWMQMSIEDCAVTALEFCNKWHHFEDEFEQEKIWSNRLQGMIEDYLNALDKAKRDVSEMSDFADALFNAGKLLYEGDPR
jgi:hypothetical protein